MNRVVVGRIYKYVASGLEVGDPNNDLVDGEEVRVIHPPGCPPPNTMGHAYVERAGGGEWFGKVRTASLKDI